MSGVPLRCSQFKNNKMQFPAHVFNTVLLYQGKNTEYCT